MSIPLRSLSSLLVAVALFGASAAAAAEAAPRIFMAGDSTMANKPLDLPERGWGMALEAHFRDGVKVHNFAENGRSTKSFLDECLWEKIVTAARAGDFVIIQFGHNDEKTEDPLRGTNPATTYRDNLRRFIRETRRLGATPILATSIARRKFNRDGKLTATHGAYPDAVRAVAAEENVTLLDLEPATMAWLQAEGPEASKRFFMWIEPGKFTALPQGRQDDTHLVAAGAEHVAALAVAQLRAARSPLAAWLR